MRRRFRRRPRWSVGIVVMLVALGAIARWYAGPRLSPPESLGEGSYTIERVVDGDTLLLTNRARIRLMGVDTPESVKPNHPVEPWGPEATEFTKDFVSSGTIRLRFDKERIDRYDRFLAYVWVDDKMLNEELVLAGLARYSPHFRFSQSMKKRFDKAQQRAKEAGRGIWSGEPSDSGNL